MFKKILSTVGIGAAKVETILKNENVKIGGFLEGEVHIFGGQVSQDITMIELELQVTYYKDSDDTEFHYPTVPIENVQIAYKFTIQPKEERVFPFQMRVPYHTPVDIGEQKVDLMTHINVKFSPDPTDIDPVLVKDETLESFIEMLKCENFNVLSKTGECIYQYEKESAHHYRQIIYLEKDDKKIQVIIYPENKKIRLIGYDGHKLSMLELIRGRKIENEKVKNFLLF